MAEKFQDFYKDILMDKSLDNIAKADKLLDAKDSFEGEDWEWLLSLAVDYLLRGNAYDRVIENCSIYVPKTSHYQFHKELYRYWIVALEKTNRWEEAIELRKLKMDELDEKTMFGDVAEAYEEAGDWDNALLYYDKHLIEEEGYLETEDMEKIATKYEEKGDLINSARYLLIAAKNECSDSAYLWQNTGRAFALANQEDEAMQYFQIALILDPQCENALYCMGQIYQNKGDQYRAMHYYTEVLKINPLNALVFNNMGAMAFNEDGDIKGAIEKIEEALEMNTDPQMELTFHINLARLYNKIFNYDKHNFHKRKIFEAAGFGGMMEEDEDDDSDE